MKKLLLVICAVFSLNILMAQKNVLIEEVTGTWCTYCPSGIYYIDSLLHNNDNVIAIAVHNQNDPMAYNDYAVILGIMSHEHRTRLNRVICTAALGLSRTNLAY